MLRAVPQLSHITFMPSTCVIFSRRQTDILNLFESLYYDNEIINTLETVSFIQRKIQISLKNISLLILSLVIAAMQNDTKT
jgi:hypothetical protein